jgi:DNA repair exonuclease SbcCD ATPase subunit
LINKATWKNYESIRDRILKSKAALDKLNESNRITITSEYADLKLEELQLVYEEAVKRQEEQDKLREAREREREEAKAQRELQAEMRRAEKREQEREEALSVARSELAMAIDAEKSKFEARVRDLEEALAKARDAKERAMSMAQQTKVGYVYIISNVGSFGEQVFKIGMTRRLEPLERVRELGDASVPFPFDVHALIFTEDAPSLERELHVAMERSRVNLANTRKEFFRASSDEVAKIVRVRFPDVVYVERPQSQEYLASLPRETLKEIVSEQREELFPATI